MEEIPTHRGEVVPAHGVFHRRHVSGAIHIQEAVLVRVSGANHGQVTLDFEIGESRHHFEMRNGQIVKVDFFITLEDVKNLGLTNNDP